ncbi:hypothetical protein AVEN_215340-1 [Araneus ventricosus]|uniref:Uncharacterized protein n=1 Tax=Araneus ventricosus TaxID=182803 RepID=A0A4Y2GFY5_ARAVE|nr:hypothetical protein AVEN_215340-1 [Araneus ventricosus]
MRDVPRRFTPVIEHGAIYNLPDRKRRHMESSGETRISAPIGNRNNILGPLTLSSVLYLQTRNPFRADNCLYRDVSLLEEGSLVGGRKDHNDVRELLDSHVKELTVDELAHKTSEQIAIVEVGAGSTRRANVRCQFGR